MIEHRDGKLDPPEDMYEVFRKVLEKPEDVRCVHVGTEEELRRLFEERMRPVVDESGATE